MFVAFFAIKGIAQTENINSGKYHPAKEHFETIYKQQEHSKYLRSQVKLEKAKAIINVVNILEFPENVGEKFKLIFGSGLLYPMAINGTPHVKIAAINELPLLNINPQTKRFSFWMFGQDEFLGKSVLLGLLENRVNPTEYYFELYNENADEMTSFEEFIDGAKLTYIQSGGIII